MYIGVDNDVDLPLSGRPWPETGTAPSLGTTHFRGSPSHSLQLGDPNGPDSTRSEEDEHCGARWRLWWTTPSHGTTCTTLCRQRGVHQHVYSPYTLFFFQENTSFVTFCTHFCTLRLTCRCVAKGYPVSGGGWGSGLSWTGARAVLEDA